MSLRRLRLIVALILAGIAGGTVAPFAAPVEAVCLLAQHECDDTPTIAECCCGNAGSALPASEPQQRAPIAPTMAAVDPFLSDPIEPFTPPGSIAAVRIVSPRTSLLDLQTLLSTFLI